jgi:hypothetical protein
VRLAEIVWVRENGLAEGGMVVVVVYMPSIFSVGGRGVSRDFA